MRSCRVWVGVTAAVLMVAAPGAARAGEKDDCFNAAEKAQKLKLDKKFTAARQQILTCARDVCPAMVKSDCVKWLNEVDTAMPTITVRARDKDGHDVVEVKVYVDGQLLLPKLEGTSVPIDPGEHKLRYEFPDGQSSEETVLIAEGEKDRVIRVEVKPQGTTAAATTSPAPGADTGTHKGGPGVVPWIIGGVGLASLVGFGLLEIPIQSQASDLQNGCGKTKSCTQAQIDSVTSLYVPAGILMGVGLAGVAVGATWLIVAAVTGGKSHEAPAAAALRLSPLPGGGMVGWQGRF
jgi:hypothetical protein